MHRACRRNFLKLSAAAGLAGLGALSSARLAAAAGSSRKFTLDLRCGAIGVGADLRKSIEYAHQFGSNRSSRLAPWPDWPRPSWTRFWPK